MPRLTHVDERMIYCEIDETDELKLPDINHDLHEWRYSEDETPSYAPEASAPPSSSFSCISSLPSALPQ